MSGPGSALRHADPRVEAVVRFYEALQPADLDRLAQLYSEQAWFKDPFNEVSGLAAIRRIFAHMFEVLHGPRFVVHDIVAEGDQCFLTWTFSFALSPRAVPLQVRGTSQLRFAPDGRVAWHRDYWDAAEELYAQLPVLGVLMRWLQRRLRSR